MIPSRSIFSIYLDSTSIPVVDVWDTLVAFLRGQRFLPKEFRLSQIAGHPQETRSETDLIRDADGVRECILERNLSAFSVSGGRAATTFRYRFTQILGDKRSSVLTTTFQERARGPNDWTKLIEGMMVQWPGVVGRQWNVAYAAWQNADNPSTYETIWGAMPLGFRINHIPSDGISPTRQIIDISKNPGRYNAIAEGVYCSPSAEMWLGPHFWQFAKCSKEEVLAADFFLEVRDTPHFLYLKSWPHPFTRPDGEQGRIQQMLWRLLFHEDCEWPPGSGGISDEPVGGPPGLMPSDSPTL